MGSFLLVKNCQWTLLPNSGVFEVSPRRLSAIVSQNKHLIELQVTPIHPKNNRQQSGAFPNDLINLMMDDCSRFGT
jgi:hypothetical protein